MKVITEERLKYLIENDGDGSKVYCTVSPADLEEIDTLTVSNLRKMSDLKIGEFAICYSDDPFLDGEKYKKSDDYNVVDINGTEIDASDFLGWVPLPTYKPEQP